MKIKELFKSCPFCGSFEIVFEKDYEVPNFYFFMLCKKCGARGPRSVEIFGKDVRKELLEKWNRRE